jgi:hypothetical protein
MRSGLGHLAEEESIPDGSMAVFCPACPQPGINLPPEWKKKYSPYVNASDPINMLMYRILEMNSSERSLWMGTFLQSI